MAGTEQAAAAALSLILLVLGAGLGLSSVSPWSQSGVTATTFGVSTILWLTFTQLVASGMGGFLAGRLRVKWVAVHSDEAYFRDTAHGFLAWAVASLATAALLTSVIGSIVGGTLQAGAPVALQSTSANSAGAAILAALPAPGKAGATNAPMAYLLDTIFRRDPAALVEADVPTARDEAATSAEVSRIFMNSIGSGDLPKEDLRYVGQVVAQLSGLTLIDAERRVADVYARAQVQLRDAQAAAKQAADTARKASAYAALWLFASLLIGAFSASVAATWGGRLRDA